MLMCKYPVSNKEFLRQLIKGRKSPKDSKSDLDYFGINTKIIFFSISRNSHNLYFIYYKSFIS